MKEIGANRMTDTKELDRQTKSVPQNDSLCGATWLLV